MRLHNRCHLDEFDRARIVRLWLYGRGPQEIAQVLSITQNTARLWIRRYQDGEGLEDRPRKAPERPPCQKSPEIEQLVVDFYQDNPGQSMKAIARELTPIVHPNNGRSFRGETVKAILLRNGIEPEHRPWKLPAETEDVIVRLYESGAKVADIQRRIGVSCKGVYNTLDRNDVERRNRCG